jgi:hypothetical protein
MTRNSFLCHPQDNGGRKISFLILGLAKVFEMDQFRIVFFVVWVTVLAYSKYAATCLLQAFHCLRRASWVVAGH